MGNTPYLGVYGLSVKDLKASHGSGIQIERYEKYGVYRVPEYTDFRKLKGCKRPGPNEVLLQIER
jgi:hypothetical protein